MTMQYFDGRFDGRFALWIPDAWTYWRVGTVDYQRFLGGIGWRQTGAHGAWIIGDVRPVSTEITTLPRTAA